MASGRGGGGREGGAQGVGSGRAPRWDRGGGERLASWRARVASYRLASRTIVASDGSARATNVLDVSLSGQRSAMGWGCP